MYTSLQCNFTTSKNSNSKPQSETKGSSHEAHWAYITGVPTVAKVTTNPQTHSDTVTKLLLQYTNYSNDNETVPIYEVVRDLK